MRFPWLKRTNDAFVRNRPILRSAVMARFDALFADRDRNAAIYESILADPATPLTADYLREVFARHSPDQSDHVGKVSSEDVVTHVFDHILGPSSWWGSDAATWRGEELLSAAYRDAVARASAAGNIPISTFHLQASADESFGLQVLETPYVVVVIICTPPVPMGPVADKLVARADPTYSPTDPRMPEVGSYTHETLPR